MKLSACFITKGEETLADAILSVRDYVDEVVVVYTGDLLTVQTAECRWLQALRPQDKLEFFGGASDEKGRVRDFARARQYSFDLATGDAAIWLDSDDVLKGGEKLRELLSTAPAGRPMMIKLPYEYMHHEETGAVSCLQWRERVVSPIGAFAWTGRVHETLEPLEPGTCVGESTAVRVVHKRKGMPDNERNARILREVLEEDPNNARAKFYLGLALFDMGDHAGARGVFCDYASMAGISSQEKATALVRLSWLAVVEGDPKKAIAWGMQAIRTRPWDMCAFAIARGWQSLARTKTGAPEREAWEQCVFWARAGLASEPPQDAIWTNPLDRQAYIWGTLNEALGRLGDLEGAAEAARRALSGDPNLPEVRSNLLIYEAALARRLEEQARAKGREIRLEAERLVESGKAPSSVRDAIYAQQGIEVARVMTPGKLDFVFLCGDAWEMWNPATIDEHGIGGSEQAVANLSRELAARGHRVRVFTNCGAPRVYEGVEWQLTKSAPEQAAGCDVLVGWRDASALEQVPSARVKLLWAHDTSLANATEWHLTLADRVMALSSWHVECLLRAHPELEASKIYKTRNGVNLSLFEGVRVPRDPKKVIYSSSPTRGLATLLKLWSEISRHISGASLHVFYGFDTWEKIARARGDEKQLAQIAEYEGMLMQSAPQGVYYRGRISPRALAREMLSAGAWLYPSKDEVSGGPWYETSCIGAMEAQLAGLHIVTTPVGALPETAPNAEFIEADDFDVTWENLFVQASVDALLGQGEAYRARVAKEARDRFSWAPVAEEWEKLAQELIGAASIAKAAE